MVVSNFGKGLTTDSVYAYRLELLLYVFLYDETVNGANRAILAFRVFSKLRVVSAIVEFEPRPAHQNL